MWLARNVLQGDSFLTLHGDLVFDAAYAQSVIDARIPSLGTVDPEAPLPEKDFKCRVADGRIREVSVGIFEGDCLAFQPFYKLSSEAMDIWLREVSRFIHKGKTEVYAENAANVVFEAMNVRPFSSAGHFVGEVDTPDDLAAASEATRLLDAAQQPVFLWENNCFSLARGSTVGAMRNANDATGILASLNINRPLVVSGSHFRDFAIKRYLDSLPNGYALFSDYSPNPTIDEAHAAFDTFRNNGCDSLVSVGGGSAIDIAKCVKALLALDGQDSGLIAGASIPFSTQPHIAVPTTAGTGSESTHFAVCYAGGKKLSAAASCLLPDVAVLDPSNLVSLPTYQRTCTLLDALCQAIESYWSVRSCEESRAYSAEAIVAIMAHVSTFLGGNAQAAKEIALAANGAGKAIDLTTTTAAHAMSYKLTSLYGIPHGHAVAMCMPPVWRILLQSDDTTVHERLSSIAQLLCGHVTASAEDRLNCFENLIANLGMGTTVEGNEEDVGILSSSVNAERLSNFPVKLTNLDLAALYECIVR